MSLDGTLKDRNGNPLGDLQNVSAILSAIFPGMTLERSLSGLEKLQLAEAQGIAFPKFLREQMASSPAKFEGDYKGSDFSIEFYAPPTEPISELNLVLRGTTASAEPQFARLQAQSGWVVTHP
jgi:hypothetical protein